MTRDEAVEAMRLTFNANRRNTVADCMARIFDDVIAPLLVDAQVHGHGMGQEEGLREGQRWLKNASGAIIGKATMVVGPVPPSDLDTFRAMLERAGVRTGNGSFNEGGFYFAESEDGKSTIRLTVDGDLFFDRATRALVTAAEAQRRREAEEE